MAPTPKKLILNLLLAADGAPLTAADAVRACGFFGIRENSVRVALVRLSAEGLLASAGRGAYQLGAGAQSVAQALSSWRQAEAQVQAWPGGWIVVSTGTLGRSDRTALRQRERAMALAGLRELDGSLHLRPDNLKGGAAALRDRLRQLGLEAEAPVFAAYELEPALDARARGLWQGKALNKAYAQSKLKLEKWLASASELEPEVAARESYLLGNDAIRQVVYDPLLPEPLVDAAARRAFADTVIAFDEAGRRIWRTVMPGLTPPTSSPKSFSPPSVLSPRKHHVA